MKFIRKNGRIIPIDDDAKKPSKKQMDKNYKKHGDGANQSAKIMQKYKDKAEKSVGFGVRAMTGALALGTLASSLIPKKPNLAISGSLALGTFASYAYGRNKINDNLKKNESNIESDHVRAFGVGSAGEKVKIMKKLKKKKK